MKKIIINTITGILFFCFSTTVSAEKYEVLDVFEEYAVEKSRLVTENMFIETSKNQSVEGVLKFTADTTEISVEIVTPPANGQVTLTDSLGSFTYTPNPDYTGTDSFQFRISRLEESSNISYCGITVWDSVPSPSPSPSPDSGFVYEDMRTHWANYSAVKLVEADVLKGERIGNRYYFHPETKMRRIDVVEYLLAALKADFSEAESAETHIFADSAVLPEYINKAAYLANKYGFLDGVREGENIYLKPYEHITRAEIIRMTDLAMKGKTMSRNSLEFTDAASIPDWAVQSVKNLLGYGIIQGFDDGSLRPFENITKAQTAEMIFQMMKYQKTSPTVSERIKNEIYGTLII